MYDEEYAKQWIANDESRKDVFRTKHLEPIIKEKIQELPKNARILDVGCGWGMVVRFLKSSQEYVGVDPTKEFFPHIKSKFPAKNLTFVEGKLPDKINVEGDFDFVICSMAIHCTKHLKKSLKTIFSKLKKDGIAFIIDFNDSAEKRLRTEVYSHVYEEDKFHVKGVATLPSGINVVSETFFHKENDFEREFKKYGPFKKDFLGPFFVIYEVTKK
tara:strand:+ start:6920 stop:7564 length:645 start_codon:yes stop_codon:yes gene_type:complete